MSDELLILEASKGRLDKLLPKMVEGLTRSQAQKMIHKGQVTVNGQIEKGNFQLKGGEKLELVFEEEEEIKLNPEDIPLDIVYEDESLLVINKPSGMVVHPSKGHSHGTLANGLLYYFRHSANPFGQSLRPGIVHRIDKDTSGLLVVAKNLESLQFLSRQLLDHSMDRSYIAIVYGHLEANQGTVKVPLARTPHNRLKWHGDLKGKQAITHFKVVEELHESSLLVLNLETGRTHQIRAHLEHIGHPILGDPLYQKGAQPSLDKQLDLSQGQLLHAQKIHFLHPQSKQLMEFEASPDPNFLKALDTLRG